MRIFRLFLVAVLLSSFCQGEGNIEEMVFFDLLFTLLQFDVDL